MTVAEALPAAQSRDDASVSIARACSQMSSPPLVPVSPRYISMAENGGALSGLMLDSGYGPILQYIVDSILPSAENPVPSWLTREVPV